MALIWLIKSVLQPFVFSFFSPPKHPKNKTKNKKKQNTMLLGGIAVFSEQFPVFFKCIILKLSQLTAFV